MTSSFIQRTSFSLAVLSALSLVACDSASRPNNARKDSVQTNESQPKPTTSATSVEQKDQLSSEYEALPAGLVMRVPRDKDGNELRDQAEMRSVQSGESVRDFGSARTAWGNAPKNDVKLTVKDSHYAFGLVNDPVVTPQAVNNVGQPNCWQENGYQYCSSEGTAIDPNAQPGASLPIQGYGYGYKSSVNEGQYWSYGDPSIFYGNNETYYYYPRPAMCCGLQPVPPLPPPPLPGQGCVGGCFLPPPPPLPCILCGVVGFVGGLLSALLPPFPMPY